MAIPVSEVEISGGIDVTALGSAGTVLNKDLRISDIRFSAEGFRFSAQGEPGKTDRIERSTDLPSWTPSASSTPSQESLRSRTIPRAPRAPGSIAALKCRALAIERRWSARSR